MFEKLKEKINQLKAFSQKTFGKIYITSKFLMIIGLISFIIVAITIFDSDLDATGNAVTIRTLLSSIVGFILESTTRKVLCNDQTLMLKNYCIGITATLIIIVLAATIIWDTNVNNPSLILFKNLLFSCVGFLISSSKECESEE